MSLLQQVLWCLAGLAELLSGWIAGLPGWLLPGVAQSTPPQDWLKHVQIRKFVQTNIHCYNEV